MATETNTARLNFRLPAHIKSVIEQAAAECGQTISDFAVSTLARAAQAVVREQQVTELTNRDRDRFLALLDDPTVRPTSALKKAAARYKKNHA